MHVHRPHYRRLPLRHAVVAWLAIGALGVAPFATPGVRHAHVASETQTVPASRPGDDHDSDEKEPVVVYRRPGALSRQLRSRRTEAAIDTAVAHHAGTATDDPATLAHSHDGAAAHVHYSILGIEFTMPAPEPTESPAGTTMIAHGEGSTQDDGGEASEDRATLGVTLVAPDRRSRPNGDSAQQTFYRRTSPVELPAVDAAARLALADARATNPDLDDDGPVPRPPRV